MLSYYYEERITIGLRLGIGCGMKVGMGNLGQGFKIWDGDYRLNWSLEI